MKLRYMLLALPLLAMPSLAADADTIRLPLRVLYVGNDRARASDYEHFLRQHFAHVTVARRDGFDRSIARDCDVVLLDWSQTENPVKESRSPFGAVADWPHPTVLLGSAGLHMAGRWQLMGGAG